ncbi:RNA polymerase II subunit A C-terminal domain phosphatase SSU72 [Smittium mucronatum]|uniref:RNA polymerase II subunit A C-terminal domain phosphatase SSU72 n=1 Tax=Smittium mucronatum TaxID=133383 RepID=A0A1R0GYW7_9FUNG|nr:RNA polymerase II subunit A C-terminal domain phosphatase SSU72 [Smittium mucronatum]
MVKFAVICASNMNRSMEGHLVLANKNMNVKSFGTGSKVRLPGDSIDRPVVYDFGTPYESIYNELKRKNAPMYKKNGLFLMLERNMALKPAPQKFQDNYEQFDVIITCEERVFDAVCQELLTRQGRFAKPVHVVNVEIRDNHIDATKGGDTITKLSELISEAKDLESEIEDILERIQNEYPHSILYNLIYY